MVKDIEILHPSIQSSYAPAVLWKISKHVTYKISFLSSPLVTYLFIRKSILFKFYLNPFMTEAVII